MSESTQERRTKNGLHAKTQPIPPMDELREKFSRASTAPLKLLVEEYLPILQHNPWPWRYREAFNWFGLVMLYLGLTFIILSFALVGTKGLILIWEEWLSGI
jgi:hypothetical protein